MARAEKRTRIVPACALALLVALLPPGAGAHGGRLAIRLTAGPYDVQAYVSLSGDNIDETLSLADAASGRPVAAGVVVLTLTSANGDARGPFVARPVGGAFEAIYPPPQGRGWTVAIDIQGPLGAASATHPYVAPASSLGDWTVTALVLAALVVVPFVAYRWWLTPGKRDRGQRAASEPADRGEQPA